MSLRPAAAVGVARQAALGGEHAAGAMGDHMALEIGRAAEQAEAVLDLPLDPHVAFGNERLRLRDARRRSGPLKAKEGGEEPQGQWRASQSEDSRRDF